MVMRGLGLTVQCSECQKRFRAVCSDKVDEDVVVICPYCSVENEVPEEGHTVIGVDQFQERFGQRR